MCVSEQPTWSSVWAMPNVSLAEPIEATYVAMVGHGDGRLREVRRRHPVLDRFIDRFRDEFGERIHPTLMLCRDDAPRGIRTNEAFGAFRDAANIAAVVVSHSCALTRERRSGIHFSDAFDVYPWNPRPDQDANLYAVTPAIVGVHDVTELRPQSTPALGERTLGRHDLDEPLLTALLAWWPDCYGNEDMTREQRRLFRALQMARAASRMPGGSDSTFHDGGRAVALWVSALEILTHDGHAGVSRVLRLLGRAPWEQQRRRAQDRMNSIDSATEVAVTAAMIYRSLYRVRNDFLHGNPVTHESLELPGCGRHLLGFAAPLFRMALAAHLDLRWHQEMPDHLADPEGVGRYVSDVRDFMAHQRRAEAAILVARTESP